MRLSVQLFRETVQRLKGEAGGDRAEKRATPRVGIRTRISLTPIGAGGASKPIVVQTRDISRVGLGVISPRKLAIGDHYLLTLTDESADEPEKPLALYCTVRCVHLLGPEMFAVGLTFEDMRAKKFPAPRAQEISNADMPSSSSSKADPFRDDVDRIRKAILS